MPGITARCSFGPVRGAFVNMPEPPSSHTVAHQNLPVRRGALGSLPGGTVERGIALAMFQRPVPPRVSAGSRLSGHMIAVKPIPWIETSPMRKVGALAARSTVSASDTGTVSGSRSSSASWLP